MENLTSVEYVSIASRIQKLGIGIGNFSVLDIEKKTVQIWCIVKFTNALYVFVVLRMYEPGLDTGNTSAVEILIISVRKKIAILDLRMWKNLKGILKHTMLRFKWKVKLNMNCEFRKIFLLFL